MTRLRGTDSATVTAALESGDPLPGASDSVSGSTRGFAGRVDGVVVRDVLGRVPVYTERGDPTAWSFAPAELDEPELVPAGRARSPGGDEQVWTLPDADPVRDEEQGVARTREAVRASLAGVDGEPAVAFSGGVDSAAVAARLDGPLYAAGFPDSHDVRAARAGATALGREVQVVELSHADIERAVPRVAAATGRTNAMDVSIATSLYLVAERAAADGHDRLALGQGADELFGGYAKVAGAPNDSRVEADTVRGARREVVHALPDGVERDVRTLRAAGVEPVVPLLDDRVVAAALALPASLLVSSQGERKWGFRRAVRAWLPDSVAFREKKAVQYGSLVSRELDRLARQAGFKRRQDDHVSRYVRSLAGTGAGQ
jgi:asparagine synthase (glutamine-hydrolysing)